ncbi:hypothetical protein PPL_04152 [Heterostelium album PN500]|uniref:Uncharacterized protein n=1 Tax=Heterostelium pallidum (strain ATCC 26659 / Pp 5 / PN500) TaxID=670386 RepID=D3B661_HETP5|nr:hypothetical protein PPL_04152 [Heterostelium album PN500]EFA83359.1 hypothetical protein PPL_04152 [Heterostelium album PN500]|eukprot:XP_020435476.1 hypothetical protein PPL_04152 [Heterostelium album PN500]
MNNNNNNNNQQIVAVAAATAVIDNIGNQKNDMTLDIAQQPFGSRSFSDEQKSLITALLNKDIPQKHTQTRPGAEGHSYVYVKTDQVIAEANRIFGSDGWSFQVLASEQQLEEEYDDCVKVGFWAHIRIILRDGTFREDVGYSVMTKKKADSQFDLLFGNCRKSAVSDALKRALRLFGRALGNHVNINNQTVIKSTPQQQIAQQQQSNQQAIQSISDEHFEYFDDLDSNNDVNVKSEPMQQQKLQQQQQFNNNSNTIKKPMPTMPVTTSTGNNNNHNISKVTMDNNQATTTTTTTTTNNSSNGSNGSGSSTKVSPLSSNRHHPYPQGMKPMPLRPMNLQAQVQTQQQQQQLQQHQHQPSHLQEYNGSFEFDFNESLVTSVK